ncbi:methylated-DNA--[protein]-cysteine S-methyltransferase [bacterium]|nr:MAG: methylated-DNA--[protein]-cysteine S-methyltransferase [bacterium]
MFTSFLNSPVGPIEITADEHAIKVVSFVDEMKATNNPNSISEEAVKQLDAYFRKELSVFDLPLAPEGTHFQKKAWDLLLQIPFGKTISYLDLAQQYGDEKAIRALASANGKNPIGVIIPCHRVIGKSGDLVGYAGGLHRKRYLLDLESNQTALFG